MQLLKGSVTMNVLYENLFDEYQNAIDIQNSIIKNNSQKLKTARAKHDFKEIKRLSSLLLVLYEERSELMERANGLRGYLRE